MKQPNIVVILADDMGWMDVGYNGSEIKTPVLDQLAREGVRLEQFYVMPACTPTRASMLTGRYSIRYGFQVGVIKPGDTYGLPQDERLLPEALKEAGYKTAITGKWHLGQHSSDQLPRARGFDHQYGCYNGMIDYFTHMFNHRIKGISAGGVTGVENIEEEWKEDGNDWSRNDEPIHEQGYATELIANEAIEVLHQHDTDQPLFLYIALTAPHSPLQVPEKYLNLYRPEDMTIPKGPMDQPIYSIKGIKPEELQRRRAIYAAMVTCMDHEIGRIMATLKKKKMDEDTLLFFCSDNGGAPDLGALNDPLRGSKTSLHEGGIRVPAFVRFPGRLESGKVVKVPLHMVDLYPSLLNRTKASLEQEKPLDGQDFWPALTGKGSFFREEILLNAAPYCGSLRMGDWKVLQNGHLESSISPEGKENRYSLYNLAEDPGESHDLSQKEPEILARLKERLQHYTKEAVPPFKTPSSWPPPPGKNDWAISIPKNWGHTV